MMEKAETRPLETVSDYSNLDPRLLRRFMKVREFREGLTPEQHSSAQFRLATAKWQPEERIVYTAVREGFTDTASLPIATGLTTEQIQKALDRLVERGALRITQVTTDEKTL